MNWYKRSQSKKYYHVVEDHKVGEGRSVVDNILEQGLTTVGGQFLTDDLFFAENMKNQMDIEGGGDFFGRILDINLTPEQESILEISPQRGEPDGLFLPDNIRPEQISLH